jgi:hypothetical protein
VLDVPKLLARVEEVLVDFNAMSKRPMNLAIFLCVKAMGSSESILPAG